MEGLIKNEIYKIVKNRMFLIAIAILSIAYFGQVFYAFTELFLSEYTWLLAFSQKSGYNIMDLLFVENLTEIVDYSHIISAKSCFLYPVYLYGRNLFLLIIPVVCLSVNGDINSKMLKIEDVYYGKHKYSLGKALAVAIITAGVFVFFAVGTVIETTILKGIYIKNSELKEVCETLEYNISFRNVISFLCVIVIIMLLTTVIVYFVTAVSYTTNGSFFGLFVAFLTMFKGNVGFVYSIRDALSYLYSRFLPLDSMCGFGIASNTYEATTQLIISFYLWVFLFGGLGLLCLKCKKECDIR